MRDSCEESNAYTHVYIYIYIYVCISVWKMIQAFISQMAAAT